MLMWWMLALLLLVASMASASSQAIIDITSAAPSSQAPSLMPSSAAPTHAPTQAPTLPPTSTPKEAPMRMPTTVDLSAAAPTRAPTQQPTLAPTLAPTGQPTFAPTGQPTRAPTVAPTTAPTLAPTLAPTAQPTLAPTSVAPSAAPTLQPTVAPTAAPTLAPTLTPTLQPTKVPTLTPTLAPTKPPTLQPTKTPTNTPTRTPTLQPTLTPTQAPTKTPTLAPTVAPTHPPAPNVLLLIADDFKPILKSYDSAKVDDDDGIKMTNLDRLAGESIVFRNAHAQIAICGPSRASFLTSLRPDTLKIYSLKPNALYNYVRSTITSKTKKEALLLPKLFKLAGYLTYGAGKIQHESEVQLMSAADVWTEPMYSAVKTTARPRAFSKPYQGAWMSSPEVEDDFFADGQAAQLSAKLITDVLTKQPKPWFLAVGLWKPHLPWNAPKKYFDMAGPPADYDPSHHLTVNGLSKSQTALAYGSGCAEVRLYTGASFVLDERRTAGKTNLSRANRAYHATALYMDAQMGVILDALNRSSARDDTIVVFLSDHGFHLGDHGLYCKHTNFEQATKVPFMIRPPLRDTHWQRGAQSFAPVELLDLMPTLYDLAGLTSAMVDKSKYATWQGTSLMPVLRDAVNGFAKAAAFSQYAHSKGSTRIMGYTVRTTRFRLTNWGSFVELYDYLKDEWETNVVQDYATKQTLLKLLGTAGKPAALSTAPFDFSQRSAIRNKPALRQFT